MLELGWTRDRLATAAPDVVEAARWRIWAEAIWPVDVVAEVFTADPIKDPAAQESRRLGAKAKAQRHYNELHALLFPPDEPEVD